MSTCRICPRECGVDRSAGTIGACGAGPYARVASAGPHWGEEDVLVGRGGSGTVFFSWCTMRCVYCQNADISYGGAGRDVSAGSLAEIFLAIQQAGCENLNLVTPTHYTAQIIDALDIAASVGLDLPLVWNTSGYEALTTLELLEGVVDIYMPDLKYADHSTAGVLSGVADYPARAFSAVRAMHGQVGDLALDARGVADAGLLVRHLVLPEGRAGTAAVACFLAEEISTDTYVNVMNQYRPCNQAQRFPPLDRRTTRDEYLSACSEAVAAGLHRFAR